MAKDKKKDRDHAASAKGSKKHAATDALVAAGQTSTHGASDAAGGQHHAAAAHGQPAKVDGRLPANRPELLTRHAAARARRNAAELGSEDFRAAVDEIARIEVRIAAIDRAADPPLG